MAPRYSCATSSLRWPLAKWTRSRSSSATKRCTPATKALVMGSISAEDANWWPRWNRKKLTTPDAYWSLGTYTLRYIRSMHSTSKVT